MNPPSSTPQDEAPTTSATIENPMSHIPKHDVTVFGVSTDLTNLNLPTHLDILRYYFYLTERAKTEQKKFSYKSFTIQVQDKLIGIWEKLGMKIMLKTSVFNKLNRLVEKYQDQIKNTNKTQQFTVYVKSLEIIFYIGTCKCDLKAAPCACGLVPERLKEFMHDQHNQRKLTVDTLKEYLNQDDPPFKDPQIPAHIQGTERHVQLLASVSKRVIPENVEAVMATTLESRAKLPRLESKKDFKQ